MGTSTYSSWCPLHWYMVTKVAMGFISKDLPFWVTLLTWINVDSDDDMGRHHLDDVAHPLTCHIVIRQCVIVVHPCIVIICPCVIIVHQLLVTTSPLATWPLLLVWEKERGWGGTLTLINMNSDDMCHHHLDDVACPLMCQVIVVHPLGWWCGVATLSSLLGWLAVVERWLWEVVAVVTKRWSQWWWCGGGWEEIVCLFTHFHFIIWSSKT